MQVNFRTIGFLITVALGIALCGNVHAQGGPRLDLNKEAVQIAIKALGIDNGVPCNEALDWKQFKYVSSPVPQGRWSPGFVQALPIPVPPGGEVQYIEYRGVTGYTVTRDSLSESDNLNGFTWRGSVSWDPGQYRIYTPLGGEEPLWTNKEAHNMLRVSLVRRNGEWRVTSMFPLNTAVPHDSCIDLTALAKKDKDEGQRRKQEDLDTLITEQRARKEENDRRYPVAPHKSDPYCFGNCRSGH